MLFDELGSTEIVSYTSNALFLHCQLFVRFDLGGESWGYHPEDFDCIHLSGNMARWMMISDDEDREIA